MLSNNSTRVIPKAFTLVELLVAIAIIGLLVALLLPAVQAARESARKISCKNNLKQIGLAMHQHEAARGSLPPGYDYAAGDEGNRLGYSWAFHLLPYLEQQPLQESFNREMPIYDWTNQVARESRIDLFYCPTDDLSPSGFVEMGEERYAMACYVANFGTPDLDEDQSQVRGQTNPLGPFSNPWGPFYRNSATRFKQIEDGLSQTLMVGERQNGPFRTPGSHGTHFEYETTWAAAVRDIDDPTDDHGHMVLFQTGHPPNAADSDDRDVSASHAGVSQFLLCDGSVHTVSEDVSLDVYRALGTMNQSEFDAAP